MLGSAGFSEEKDNGSGYSCQSVKILTLTQNISHVIPQLDTGFIHDNIGQLKDGPEPKIDSVKLLSTCFIDSNSIYNTVNRVLYFLLISKTIHFLKNNLCHFSSLWWLNIETMHQWYLLYLRQNVITVITHVCSLITQFDRFWEWLLLYLPKLSFLLSFPLMSCHFRIFSTALVTVQRFRARKTLKTQRLVT